MIIVDLEMSGLNSIKNGIFEIGAVDTEDSKNQFFEECRIDGGDLSDKGALRATGKTDEELRAPNKQSEKELLENFFSWVRKTNNMTIVCQNFDDVIFLKIKADKYELEYPFHYRALELHTLAHMKYFEIKKEFDFKEGISDFGLRKTLKFVGMDDNRNGHNALEDAKLEAECFSRLVYGKNLLEEFKEFEIPDYLKKD